MVNNRHIRPAIRQGWFIHEAVYDCACQLESCVVILGSYHKDYGNVGVKAAASLPSKSQQEAERTSNFIACYAPHYIAGTNLALSTDEPLSFSRPVVHPELRMILYCEAQRWYIDNWSIVAADR